MTADPDAATPSVTYLQPLVHTLGMELVITGQHAEQLAGFKVAHTHDTPVTTKISGFKLIVCGGQKPPSALKPCSCRLTVFAQTDGCWG